MGYLFLVTALFAGATKGFCGKKISGYTSGYRDAMLANTLRMILCIVIGIILIISEGSIAYLIPTMKLTLISALSGITTSVFVVTWLISVKKGSYMMLDVFLMLGTLVPLILSRIFFAEAVLWNHILGIFILLIAVIIMCSYNNSIKEKISISAFLILVLCGIANGFTDFSQKLFVKQMAGVPVSVFNFYTYVFSAVTLLVFFFLLKNKEDNAEEKSMGIKNVFGYIFVMSVCLFANSYFKTLAAEYLDSARLYPLNQGSALILSSVMSAIFFKEKMTLKGIIGIALSFVGLLVINVL